MFKLFELNKETRSFIINLNDLRTNEIFTLEVLRAGNVRISDKNACLVKHSKVLKPSKKFSFQLKTGSGLFACLL